MFGDFRERFWDTVCGFRLFFVFLFVMTVVLWILLGIALFLGPGNDDTITIIYVDFAVLTAAMLLAGYPLIRCE